jgi:hypothetical protein
MIDARAFESSALELLQIDAEDLIRASEHGLHILDRFVDVVEAVVEGGVGSQPRVELGFSGIGRLLCLRHGFLIIALMRSKCVYLRLLIVDVLENRVAHGRIDPVDVIRKDRDDVCLQPAPPGR